MNATYGAYSGAVLPPTVGRALGHGATGVRCLEVVRESRELQGGAGGGQQRGDGGDELHLAQVPAGGAGAEPCVVQLREEEPALGRLERCDPALWGGVGRLPASRGARAAPAAAWQRRAALCREGSLVCVGQSVREGISVDAELLLALPPAQGAR